MDLPPPAQRVAVAVYNFTDQTGQFKPSDSVQTLSRAVTQGATSILVKTLQDAGNRQWFTVIERERLDNVLRERAVIREMRASYLGEKSLNPQALPPLLFAGILLEGGIIGYDSNTKTGGSGARFLGIGATTQYREDTVTIYLRAVSTKTGEVLNSVSVRKSIQSVGIGANAFRFVAFKDLLEIDTGVTYNEPDQLALTQAIEKAVHALIVEGALQDLWCFRTDPATAAGIATTYLAERENSERSAISLARRSDGSLADGACRTTPVAQVPAPRPAIVQPLASGLVPVEQAAMRSTASTAPVSAAGKPSAGAQAMPPTIRSPVPATAPAAAKQPPVVQPRPAVAQSQVLDAAPSPRPVPAPPQSVQVAAPAPAPRPEPQPRQPVGQALPVAPPGAAQPARRPRRRSIRKGAC